MVQSTDHKDPHGCNEGESGMSLLAMFQKIVSALESVLKSQLLGSRYRPELHYMRGPGPKWNARHASVPVRTARR
jgi:hypothetical protein